jgi:hypothetical protein
VTVKVQSRTSSPLCCSIGFHVGLSRALRLKM